MNRWISDRPPTVEELAEFDYCFVYQGNQVKFATGFSARLMWGKTVFAWEPPPTEFYGDEDDFIESAELLVAMRNDDIAKMREILKRK
jgi:hypothetical protein